MANQKPTDWNVTLDQVVDLVRDEVRGAVDKYCDLLQKTVSSSKLEGTELGEKVKDGAEKNIAMTRDYLHKLSQAKDFLEVVPIQTEFMRAQLDLFGEHIKSFGETYTKTATEMLNTPIRTVP